MSAYTTLFTDQAQIHPTTGSGKHSAAGMVAGDLVHSAMSGILAKLEARLDPQEKLADLYARVQRNQGGRS
ncbi:hypothetical protein [Actinomadura sp. GTD37]|uniref:hypothetical protein n=1 Tax=Actinomadura sp. GTD37 TaxID=1778030 RepID=UPI0035C09E19